jgi:hypothetical protein
MRTFDGRQLTAARALAELTVIELAAAAGVTPRTTHRLEIGGVIDVADKRRHGHVSKDVWDRIVGALEQYGVELVPESGDQGAGARWIQPRGTRTALKSACPLVTRPTPVFAGADAFRSEIVDADAYLPVKRRKPKRS